VDKDTAIVVPDREKILEFLGVGKDSVLYLWCTDDNLIKPT